MAACPARGSRRVRGRRGCACRRWPSRSAPDSLRPRKPAPHQWFVRLPPLTPAGGGRSRAHIPSPEIGSGYFQETHPEQPFSGMLQLLRTCFRRPEQMPRALEIAVRRSIYERCVSVIVIPGDVALKPAANASAPLPMGLMPAQSIVMPPYPVARQARPTSSTRPGASRCSAAAVARARMTN